MITAPRLFGADALDLASPTPGIRILLCGWEPPLTDWARDNYSAPYWRLYWNPTPGARVELAGRSVPLLPDRYHFSRLLGVGPAEYRRRRESTLETRR